MALCRLFCARDTEAWNSPGGARGPPRTTPGTPKERLGGSPGRPWGTPWGTLLVDPPCGYIPGGPLGTLIGEYRMIYDGFTG